MDELIGISLTCLGPFGWTEFKKIPELEEMPIIEINRNYNPIRFRIQKIESIKNRITPTDKLLSLHGASSFIFGGDSLYNKISRDVFSAEIELCSELGIKRIIFHIVDFDENKKQAIDFLKEVKEKADKLEVEIVLENNSHSSMKTYQELQEVINEVGCKVNVDIGHLKTANKSDIQRSKEFVDKLKEHIVHVHAHSNDGKKDLHNAMHEYDKFEVEMIKYIHKTVKNEVWWIAENKKFEDAMTTYNTLKQVLG